LESVLHAPVLFTLLEPGFAINGPNTLLTPYPHEGAPAQFR
jgi:hypothetical protein